MLYIKLFIEREKNTGQSAPECPFNNTVHSHNNRINENFRLASVSKNLGKRRVQYKVTKIWNQLPTSLKRFYTIKKFNTKAKNPYSQQT